MMRSNDSLVHQDIEERQNNDAWKNEFCVSVKGHRSKAIFGFAPTQKGDPSQKPKSHFFTDALTPLRSKILS
jgi:hypothetical protein